MWRGLSESESTCLKACENSLVCTAVEWLASEGDTNDHNCAMLFGTTVWANNFALGADWMCFHKPRLDWNHLTSLTGAQMQDVISELNVVGKDSEDF